MQLKKKAEPNQRFVYFANSSDSGSEVVILYLVRPNCRELG